MYSPAITDEQSQSIQDPKLGLVQGGVTAVIPTHNSQATIARALRSVFSQEYSKLSSVLVIDDASTDKTVELVQQLACEAPPHIELKLIGNRDNSGGGFCRNRGIDASKTEFVALLDADDEWTPNHLSTSISTLSERRLDLVFASPEHFSNGPKYKSGSSPLEFIFVHGGIAQTSSFVFRNWSCLRFDETLLKHQDFDFIMSAFRRGLAIDQLSQFTTKYHDVRGIRSRVSKQRRPKSSRRFLLKWRRQMSADARLCFLVRFHFYNRGSIDFGMAAWALTRVARSNIATSVKLRLVRSILKGLLPR
ncbi:MULTISPECIES: glycosyltransferase family 2 protein [unclassified Bradyrhizobium]|uniref:glycosyltransferase family 2 protein n=1 Tax=unclassified Bradyrhizobium TaxID=2631580 RepID=UPI001FF7C133|nr:MULTISPECIES: glycosyltransferase family 2 protein [unclassified Bradyrhizobium]MCK1707680.1 glycosyltransferase family 2 protein [Bradyrhizobium sp. 143]MCK1731752.1 glycosyltransferase family 2 protein [Bradyrhizobium sp. 142]